MPAPTSSSSEGFADFRCEWQETGLFGDTSAFGLTIRFFPGDGRALVRLDGEGRRWEPAAVTTRHGAAERWDMFVGSKVVVFGRTLSIGSSSFEVCREIERLGDRLRARQSWLRSRVEAVGGVPVVRGPGLEPLVLDFRHTSSGRSNLRKLATENNRLAEQLCALGMGHLLAQRSLC